MESIRHIFFDLDNTLWDYDQNARLALTDIYNSLNLQTRYGINFNDFHTAFRNSNYDLWRLIRDNKIDIKYLRKHRFYDTLLKLDIHNQELSTQLETMFLEGMIEYNFLIKSALDCLHFLKKKYQLHIISNGAENITNRKINLSNLSDFFTTITTADSTGFRKPRVEIFEFALTSAQAKNDESIMIGDDWTADILGANDSGMKAIFYNPNRIKRDGYTTNNYKEIFHLNELRTIL